MYGRIEIVARLPRGDWIFPRLWLQPQEYKYDKTNYKAGVIYVGSIENSPPGVYLVKQGIALGAEDPVRSMLLSPRRMPKDWDKSFHTFIVEWTPGKYLYIPLIKSEIILFFIFQMASLSGSTRSRAILVIGGIMREIFQALMHGATNKPPLPSIRSST